MRQPHSLAVGTIVRDEVVDLTGVFRLRFDIATSATTGTQAAVATPQILCTRERAPDPQRRARPDSQARACPPCA